MGILIIWTSWEGTVIHIWRWSNLVVTLALKFKVVLYHACNFDLSVHVSICVRYKDVLNYGIGSISHTFGVLVSGCTHMHANCILEYIRLSYMCMLIYRMTVAGNLILRQSSTNGYLVWSLKFFPLKVVDFVVEFEQKEYSTANSNSKIKSTTVKWKNFNDHTKNPFVEFCLRIRVPSTIVWYINIHKNRSLIHSKLQFACICVQPDTNTPNVWLIDPLP